MAKQSAARCDDLEPFLSAYMDDQLDAAQRDQVLTHLKGCTRCMARLEAFQQIDRWVDGQFTGQEFPRWLQAAAMTSLWRRWFQRKNAWWAVAAAVAATVMLGVFFRGTQRPPGLMRADFNVQPAMNLIQLNRRSSEDQLDMIETMELDLRTLRLELGVADVGDRDQLRLLDRRIESLMAQIEQAKNAP